MSARPDRAKSGSRAVPLRAVLALATAAFASAAVGCDRRPIDVVWVVVDALPARATGLYGGRSDVTPQLAAIAERAIVIENAYAQAPSTLPSAAAYLTGVYPDRAVAAVRDGSAPQLGQWLRAAGYRTAAFSENPWVSHLWGFDAGFEVFEEISHPPDRPRGYRDSAATLEAALAWLLDDDAKPSFLYLHLLRPHAPYVPPPPFRGMLTDPEAAPAGEEVEKLLDGRTPPDQALMTIMLAAREGQIAFAPKLIEYVERRYLENVAFADHLVGLLWERIEHAGRSESTLLVISSDHGEAFGPHPELFHGSTLYDDQIRVPLLIVAPQSLGLEAKRRISGMVELVDIAPTVLDLLGLEVDAAFDGASIVPWLRSEGEPPDVARAFLDEAQAVVGREWKLIQSPSGRALFERGSDPDELRDRGDEQPEQVAELAALLAPRESATATGDPPALPPEVIAELESIGYAAGEGGKGDERRSRATESRKSSR